MDRGYPRKRSGSPSHRRERPFRERGEYRNDREPSHSYREFDKRKHYEKGEYANREVEKKVPDVKAPAGFPNGYSWNKGDWLCPSPGCEGYVTSSRFRNCIRCGRAQPHFTVLMELAKGEAYRTRLCTTGSCEGGSCMSAHSALELRDLEQTRILKRARDDSPPAVRSPTGEEISEFVSRWKIVEPGVSVLKRLPGTLCDLMLRSFAVSPEETNVTRALLKSLADIIRPKLLSVNTHSAFHDLLVALLKVYTGPIGVACSSGGQLAVTLEKEVALVRLRDYSNEDLGLLAFALSFAGLTVVYSLADKIQLSAHFPKIYSDLFIRVRLVDNPSEIIYRAEDPIEEVTDRATQAKIDALTNPAPLLPTPPKEEHAA